MDNRRIQKIRHIRVKLNSRISRSNWTSWLALRPITPEHCGCCFSWVVTCRAAGLYDIGKWTRLSAYVCKHVAGASRNGKCCTTSTESTDTKNCTRCWSVLEAGSCCTYHGNSIALDAARPWSSTRGVFPLKKLKKLRKMWMREVQKACHTQELSDLEAGKQVHKSKKIYSLSPMLKNGLICVETRLSQYSHLSGVAKFPPVLGSSVYGVTNRASTSQNGAPSR